VVFGPELDAARPLEVLGVHTGWLDAQGRIRRAIRYDAATDTLIEADLPQPLRPHASLVIACSAAVHTALDTRLQRAGIPCGNPAPQAALADDKWGCYHRWLECGVPTPPTYLLPAATGHHQVRRLVADTLARHPTTRGWFLQPRHGTEGRGVVWVPVGRMAAAAIHSGWHSLRAKDDAILRPCVGTLGVPIEKGHVAWDLRVNVCYDGQRHTGTSAYLLVARHSSQAITSVSCGGRTLPYRWLQGKRLQSLGVDGGDGVPWSAALLAAATRAAEAAVGSLAPFSIAGADIKFDLDGATPACSVLDVNPRPAGLLHSDLLAATEPGIGAQLWRGLAHLAAGAAA